MLIAGRTKPRPLPTLKLLLRPEASSLGRRGKPWSRGAEASEGKNPESPQMQMNREGVRALDGNSLGLVVTCHVTQMSGMTQKHQLSAASWLGTVTGLRGGHLGQSQTACWQGLQLLLLPGKNLSKLSLGVWQQSPGLGEPQSFSAVQSPDAAGTMTQASSRGSKTCRSHLACREEQLTSGQLRVDLLLRPGLSCANADITGKLQGTWQVEGCFILGHLGLALQLVGCSSLD